MGHTHSHEQHGPGDGLGQNHGHGHEHSHGHGHSHAPASFGRAFAVGITLNTGFVLAEAIFGYLSGSMALIADAGHNLSDVLALLLAWGASAAAARAPSTRFTYGYKSATILAALANAALLLIALGAILFETLRRFAEPAPIEGMTMVAVAGVGIAINTITALMFMRGRHSDLNIRGAFLHMAADALVSLGVVVAGLLILATGQNWIDPVTSLVIIAVIGWGTWGLARDSVALGLNGVPAGISETAVRELLERQQGVSAVHDLHIWPMSTTETSLTAHLVMPEGHPGDSFLHALAQTLEGDHHIGHITVQIETGTDVCGIESHTHR